MFKGSIVALVTPFANGKVDTRQIEKLVEFHLANKTNGISPVGTTGEAPTLSHEEKEEVIRTVIRAVRGKVPVIAGTGTNDTKTTIEYTRMAKDLKADAALVVTPYYNKPTQEGLFRHYEAVAKSVDIPIVVYNVPGRTSVNLLPETLARMSKIKNIVAVKEASGDLEQVYRIRALCDITVLSGDDALTYPVLSMGGKGVISVAANVIPGPMSELCEAYEKGNTARAKELHAQYLELMNALFIETNPIPVKTALQFMGMNNGEFRLPLCEMAPANAEKLKAVMKKYKLVS